MPPPSAVNPAALDSVAAIVRAAGVFGEVRVQRGMLTAAALASAEPAEYRLFVEDGRVWVGLVTEHRWLSQSIEADLVHTGDKMEDLIEEELVEQGLEGVRLAVEHFRDDHKMYTFRSPIPVQPGELASARGSQLAAKALLAYEATFRPLGDMEADEED